MVLSKKGIIFTLIAVGLSGLFILLYTASFSVPVNQDNENIRSRVTSLDDAITQFYDYASEAENIAGFSSLQALYEEINTSGTYLGSGNFPERFIDCMNTSTGCTNDEDFATLLDNFTTILKASTGSAIAYRVTNLELIGETYDSLIVTSNITLTLKDAYASWDHSQTVTSVISTNGAYDPLYISINRRFSGTEDRRISIHDSTASSAIQNVLDFYAGKQYQPVNKEDYPAVKAPCLSERFEGLFNTDTQGCGIESIVQTADHPWLNNASSYNITHLDWQVAALPDSIRSACNKDNQDDFRVDVSVVSGNLTLDDQTLARYDIFEDQYLSYEGSYWDSRGC